MIYSINAALLLPAPATVVALEIVYLPIQIVTRGSMVMGNVPGYLLTLNIWRIQLTARSHLLWCKIIGGKFWQDCETSVVKFQDCKFYFFVPKSDEIFRCKFFFNLEGGLSML